MVKRKPAAWCSACEKRLWRTNVTARFAATVDTGYSGVTMRVYRCPIHRGWHLSQEPTP